MMPAVFPKFLVIGRVEGAGHMRFSVQHGADLPYQELEFPLLVSPLLPPSFFAGFLVVLTGFQDLENAFALDLLLQAL